MNDKIKRHHLERRAIVYLRPSTLKQVLQHRESTARQYGLAARAADLGWRADLIDVIDEDLGQSGTSAEGRAGFQRLAEAVARGRVGALFALEISRLARSSADWHRLLELAGLADVVIVDEQAVYSPRDHNDRMLLGLKGAMSEAELHWMRLRLEGGRMNKALRGDYYFLPASGYVWDREHQRFRMDPDEQVQRAVRLVFERFRIDGRAYAVARYFAEHRLMLPARNPTDRQLRWVQPGAQLILAMLHNPIYAGAYVYGRSEERTALVDGQIRRRHKTRFPREQWKVCLRGHHPGYITWEEFMRNEEKLRDNRTHADGPRPRGASRSGPALLQGLVLCGRCGSRMSVQYSGRSRGQYLCRNSSRPSKDSTICWAVAAEAIDEAVERLFLEAVQLPEIELGLAITRETERQAEGIDAQWKLRLDRARYDASLAERRYKAVDPDNRVIARTLEREWEENARDVESIEREHAEIKRRAKLEITPADRERIRAMSKDLRQVWSARTTTDDDRKNLLRMLVREVALVPTDGSRRRTQVRVLWQTGAVNELVVVGQNPRERLATCPEAVTLIRELVAEGKRDQEIAAELNRRAIMTAVSRRWGVSSVRWVRFRHGLSRRRSGARAANPTQQADPRDGLYTSRMLAARFGVGETTVSRWVSRGLLHPETGGGQGHSFRFRIDEATEIALREAARKIHEPNGGLYTTAMIAERFGVNEATVYGWIARGLLRSEAGGGKGRPFTFRLDAEIDKTLLAAAKQAHETRGRRRAR